MASADGDPVGGWKDQSGNGFHVTQATAGKRPTLRLNVQNARPVLRFDGVDDFLRMTASQGVLSTGNAPFTLFLVGKTSNVNTNQVPFEIGANPASNLTVYRWYGFGANGFSGTLFQSNWNNDRGTANGVVVANTCTLVCFSHAAVAFSASDPTFFKDGVSQASAQGTGTAAPNLPNSSLTAMTVGSDQEPTQAEFFNGDVAEVVLYNTALSTADRQSVENYLLAKYRTGDANGRTTLTYDGAGGLKTATNPSGLRISYAYDTVGQRAVVTEPSAGGRFSYSYDAAQQIIRLTNPQAQRTSWTYDDAGRRTSARLANGVRASYLYDDADQLTRLANVTSSGTTLSSFSYRNDPMGNRTRVVEANGDVVTWSYDNIYQLTREQRSGASSYSITHAYDAAGNRLRKADGGSPATYTYDVANQLKTRQDGTGRTTFVFDSNGNQATQLAPAGRTTHAWDYENRLTQVLLPAGLRNTFQYDAAGKRIRKDDSTGTTKAVWDKENVLLETDQHTVAQVVYTLEPVVYGNLISQRRGNQASFFHFDGLGTTDRLSDATATVTDSYIYDSFGHSVSSTGGTTNPFRYHGSQGYYLDADETAYYIRARSYRPDLPAFLSRDISLLRPYVYCNNTPLALSDPSGRIDRRIDLTLMNFPQNRFCGRFGIGFNIHPTDPERQMTLVLYFCVDIVVTPCDVKKEPCKPPICRSEHKLKGKCCIWEPFWVRGEIVSAEGPSGPAEDYHASQGADDSCCDDTANSTHIRTGRFYFFDNPLGRAPIIGKEEEKRGWIKIPCGDFAIKANKGSKEAAYQPPPQGKQLPGKLPAWLEPLKGGVVESIGWKLRMQSICCTLETKSQVLEVSWEGKAGNQINDPFIYKDCR